MSTTIRPETSKKKSHWIPKHRYYELKHYIMQKPEFEKEYQNALDGFQKQSPVDYIFTATSKVSNPTEQAALYRDAYLKKITDIDDAAYEADPVIGPMIVDNVIEGIGYEGTAGIPCGKEKYYEIYRKFFWLLSKKRG